MIIVPQLREDATPAENRLALKDARARLKPGDSIRLPAGTYNFGPELFVSDFAGIPGAGIDKTIIKTQ